MKEIYIFDFDGVVNFPTTHQLDERVVERIAGLLTGGNLVAFNTGRAIKWFDEQIVPGFRAAGVDTEHLANLVIVTEKGGEYTEFIGGKQHTVVSENAISQSVRDKSFEVFKSMPELARTIHWNDRKKTLITAAKISEATMDEYLSQKFALEDALAKALVGEEVYLDIIVNAVDIQHPKAGKYGGTKLIYDWVTKRTDIRDCHFTCFGDSKSDYDMPRFLIDQGSEVKFVFTGESLDGVEVDTRVELIKPEGLYADATISYFVSNNL